LTADAAAPAWKGVAAARCLENSTLLRSFGDAIAASNNVFRKRPEKNTL